MKNCENDRSLESRTGIPEGNPFCWHLNLNSKDFKGDFHPSKLTQLLVFFYHNNVKLYLHQLVRRQNCKMEMSLIFFTLRQHLRSFHSFPFLLLTQLREFNLAFSSFLAPTVIMVYYISAAAAAATFSDFHAVHSCNLHLYSHLLSSSLPTAAFFHSWVQMVIVRSLYRNILALLKMFWNTVVSSLPIIQHRINDHISNIISHCFL